MAIIGHPRIACAFYLNVPAKKASRAFWAHNPECGLLSEHPPQAPFDRMGDPCGCAFFSNRLGEFLSGLHNNLDGFITYLLEDIFLQWFYWKGILSSSFFIKLAKIVVHTASGKDAMWIIRDNKVRWIIKVATG